MLGRLRQRVEDMMDAWRDAGQKSDIAKTIADYSESLALQGRYGAAEQARAMNRARLWARHISTPDPAGNHDYSIFGD